jgi:hypothetical protein
MKPEDNHLNHSRRSQAAVATDSPGVVVVVFIIVVIALPRDRGTHHDTFLLSR